MSLRPKKMQIDLVAHVGIKLVAQKVLVNFIPLPH